MSRKCFIGGILFVCAAPLLTLVGCGRVHAQGEAVGRDDAPAPPPANVVLAPDPALFSVDYHEQFPLAMAEEHPTRSELVVTGLVTPDASCPSSHKFQEHSAAAPRWDFTGHFFLRPAFDLHHVHNLSEFGSDWVPQYSDGSGTALEEKNDAVLEQRT
jgi:hypothetical protein